MAGYIWLRGYMPIQVAGTAGIGPSSPNVQLENSGSEGRTVRYVVSGGGRSRFGVYFDITNTGRLPITIEGLAGDRGGNFLSPRIRLHSGVQPGANHFPGFRPLTLDSGETAFLGLEVVARTPCEGYAPGTGMVWDSVSIRYNYARFFERETSLQLPLAMSLAC